MTISTGNFPEELWPGIHDHWGIFYKKWEPLYEKCFEVKTSDKSFEKEQQITSYPIAMVKDQGSPVSYVDAKQGVQKEYVPITYALGTSFTWEMNQDDQYGHLKRLPKTLSWSMREAEETTAFDHFNRATTAAYTGADGLTLLNASHTLVGGGTYRNQLSTASDLSNSSLETALMDLSDWTDDQQKKIRVKAKTLLIPTALQATAFKILNTMQVTGSNDNDKSWVATQGLKLVVSPYLTDPDAWFLITDVDNGMVFYWRSKPEVSRDNEFDTKNLKVATIARFMSGWTDPHGVFGTIGAA